MRNRYSSSIPKTKTKFNSRQKKNFDISVKIMTPEFAAFMMYAELLKWVNSTKYKKKPMEVMLVKKQAKQPLKNKEEFLVNRLVARLAGRLARRLAARQERRLAARQAMRLTASLAASPTARQDKSAVTMNWVELLEAQPENWQGNSFVRNMGNKVGDQQDRWQKKTKFQLEQQGILMIN